jgi:nucleotide-binding universal stress UspA family protein
VPVGGYKIGIKAAGHAIHLAKLMDAEVEIFHVIPETSKNETDKKFLEDKVEEAVTVFSNLFGQSYMKEIQETCSRKGCKMKTKIAHGEPGPLIIEEAKKEDIDLIVMGRRSEPTAPKPIGTVSEYVLKFSKCPVLIVTYSSPDFS